MEFTDPEGNHRVHRRVTACAVINRASEASGAPEIARGDTFLRDSGEAARGAGGQPLRRRGRSRVADADEPARHRPRTRRERDGAPRSVGARGDRLRRASIRPTRGTRCTHCRSAAQYWLPVARPTNDGRAREHGRDRSDPAVGLGAGSAREGAAGGEASARSGRAFPGLRQPDITQRPGAQVSGIAGDQVRPRTGRRRHCGATWRRGLPRSNR